MADRYLARCGFSHPLTINQIRSETKPFGTRCLALCLADCADEVIVFWAEESERPHVAVTYNTLRINHEDRSRHLARNQGLRAVQIRDFTTNIGNSRKGRS